MTTSESPSPILYASVSHGSIVLADLLPPGTDPDLPTLASRFLLEAPRNHLHFTHTAEGRIRAFVVADPIIFFAITDEAHGRSQTLHLLNRLRDAFSFSPALKKVRVTGPGAPHCLQHELLPVLRRVLMPLQSHDDKAHPTLSGLTSSSSLHEERTGPSPTPSPQTSPLPSPGEEKAVDNKKSKKKEKDEKKKKKKDYHHHNMMSINIITF